ncbi:MAG TPA: 1-deoxy-D-xylulose-5-phosphate synthase N-terminal domain-containing protein, partial [bacterium]|nr:1-deoxy-D-xylulose-5-phosphate synthase N-terminal domain-containing protein [bacterium]
AMDLNLLVILNDNGMSIDQNVGAISRTLTRITTSDSYNAIRDEVKRVTGKVPFGLEILKSLKHMERSVKDFVSPDTAGFFESLNFRYFGPVQGHNLRELLPVMAHVRTMRGPILLHVSTVKGKGLGAGIENTFEAHAVSPASTKEVNSPPRKSWTRIYTEGLQDLMARDPAVVALTAAMMSNTGLAPLKERYPNRVLDVGIAEANAYCSAAGMAIGGLKPFVTVYSTFSQRAFDQLIHDIALQSLPVRIMMDRGGFVGNDGPTHHGVFDHSYLRLIPGMVHMAPRNELEMRRMLLTAWHYQDGPIAMRYPRGETAAMASEGPLEPIPIGCGELVREGRHAGMLLVAVGSQVATALEAAERLEAQGVPCAVVDARFIKPLDERLLVEQAGAARAVLTLEENVLAGGLGEGLLALLAEHGVQRPFHMLGAPDRFVSFGSQTDQLRESGLTVPQVLEAALDLWQAAVRAPSFLRRLQA